MTKLSFICVARHFIQIQHKKVKGCSKQTKHVSACEVGPGFHRVEYLFFFYWRMPIHLFRLEINQMRNPLRHLRGTRPERQGRSRAMSGIIRMFVTSTAAGNKQKTNRAADGTHSVAEGLNRILQKNWTIGHRKNWNKTKERRFIFTSGDGRNRRRWPDFRSVSHLSKSTLDQPFRWPYCVRFRILVPLFSVSPVFRAVICIFF